MKEVVYFTLSCKSPILKWIAKLGAQEKQLVLKYIDRLAKGNTGAAKSLQGGLWELRLHASSGLRIYFAYEGDTLIILLCGGDKATQKKDIAKARFYLEIWRDNYDHSN